MNTQKKRSPFHQAALFPVATPPLSEELVHAENLLFILLHS